jgi:signal transduction histidine kinase
MAFGDVCCASLLYAAMVLLSLASCSSPSKQENIFSVKANDTLVPPEIKPAGEPYRRSLEKRRVPPTVIQVPEKPRVFKVPNPIQYANNPMPTTLHLSPPSTRPGGFYPRIRTLTITDGLPTNNIGSLYIDRAGNLWMGNPNIGLVRYDGNTFAILKRRVTDGPVSWKIIGEDSKGNLWTNAGKYDGRTLTNFNRLDTLQKLGGAQEMAEGSDGTLWFRSRNIVRFNGRNFTRITRQDGLRGNLFFSIFNDSRGRIWIGSDTGLNRFTGRSFDFIGREKGLVEGQVKVIQEDHQHQIWFGTTNGLVKYDGETYTTYTTADGLPGNDVNTLAVDTENNLWIGVRNGGLCRYDGRSFRVFGNADGISGSVNEAVADQKGGIWFWGNDTRGVMYYGGEAVSVFRGNIGLDKEGGISEDLAIVGMAEDSAGRYWFGGAGFAYYYDGKTFTHYGSEQGLLAYGSENAAVMSIVKDGKGRLCFGMLGGNFSVFDGSSFTHYTSNEGFGGRMTLALAGDSRGRIWTSIADADHENIFCFDGQRILGYGTKQGLVDGIIYSMYEDSQGNMWFAGGKGVSVFNGKRFINFTSAQGPPGVRVSRILQDRDGNMLLTTLGGGLLVLRREKLDKLDSLASLRPYRNVFENYTVNDGLPDNMIYSVSRDSANNIFLGSLQGLTILRGGLALPGSGIARSGIEHFGEGNGYPISEVNSILSDSKGVLWLSCSGRFIRFDYSKILQSGESPAVSIRDIRVNDERISWYNLQSVKQANGNAVADSIGTDPRIIEELSLFGELMPDSLRNIMITRYAGISFDSIRRFNPVPENLSLPFRHNNITIHFSAIAPARPAMMRYQYKLEGYNDEWSPVTEKTTAAFGNMKEGKYTFLVRAMGLSPNTAWSEPVAYVFRVQPPWYRTWWAYVLFALGFIAALTAFIRWRIAYLEKEKLALEKQVAVRTQELKEANAEVEQSLHELKTTQQELIQREKMASLGELTAGIAHEIQNPLNFVNNFTEVNQELISELKQEIESGNIPEIRAIVDDISSNEQKILLHGKRADAIVKSMLQHSRAGSGKKEPTDINALADEYIRLAYHGMRAKDKSFNASWQTDFDPSLGKVNIVAQDIGRVILNMVNNAFYAVNEKAKNAVGPYEPMVHLSTRKASGSVEIRVKDNGPGMPEKTREKIFQPFFTTKPTGHGTGLGLSISFDIIKAHGGEIRVVSEPGTGTEFVILLPAV